MRLTRRTQAQIYRSRYLHLFLPTLMGFVVLIAGCGSKSSPTSGSGPIAGESTTVAIQLSSTANGQFTQFGTTIGSITLTNQAGKSTTIFDTPGTLGTSPSFDFILANGAAFPLVTVSVPQDVYTSASISIPNSGFSYVFVDSTGEGNYDLDDDNGPTPTAPVVTLPEPITVEGSTLGLKLDLLASQSGSFTGAGAVPAVYSITPTFQLSSFAIPETAPTPLNGACLGLSGQVTAIDVAAGMMSVSLAGLPVPNSTNPESNVGTVFSVALNSATQYQGVSASALAVGTFVNLDLALQPDASYLATRIEVQDATTANITSGLDLQVASANTSFFPMQTQQQGAQIAQSRFPTLSSFTATNSTKFQTSARFPGLGSLPFTAVFNSSTMAAGQVISIGAQSYTATGSYPYSPPTSITLSPQTIDGLVTAVSGSGNYTVYTVQLAAYDPIVQENSPLRPSVFTVLPHPNVIEVYVNSSTSLLNSTALGVGQTFRFNGLLFNDTGVFRMVCDQISDGVPQ
jgi:hypothetical protein